MKKKRKRRKPHLREKIGLCGERKLNLLNIKMMIVTVYTLPIRLPAKSAFAGSLIGSL